MPNVVFFTSLAQELAEQITLPAPADYNVSIHPISLPAAEKIAILQDTDFLIIFPSRLADEVLRAAPKLQLIQLVSAGFDTMNLPLLAELGIPLANNGGANAIDVAEHTIAMMLALYRRFRELDPLVRSGGWREIDTGTCTYTIDGKMVGIIGLGNIGQQVAKRLAGWGAYLLYYDAFPQSAAVEQALNITRVTLEELLRESDIVTLHTPLNEQTRGIINQERLALMKPNAVIVNTCRGPVVNQADIIDALQRGQIAGAALDVLEQEPPAADNPLFQMDNVLLSPHTAGITYDTWARRGRFIFENLQRVRGGEVPLAQVDYQ